MVKLSSTHDPLASHARQLVRSNRTVMLPIRTAATAVTPQPTRVMELSTDRRQ